MFVLFETQVMLTLHPGDMDAEIWSAGVCGFFTGFFPGFFDVLTLVHRQDCCGFDQ
jgi:hypothetical protein